MAIIVLCKRCKGKGKMQTKIPFIKVKCSICNGTGKIKDFKN
jgi:DnaJ-class molecular chaperone